MAKVFLEWVKLAPAGEVRSADIFDSVAADSEIIADILATPKLSSPAPPWAAESRQQVDRGFARITVLEGAVLAAWGPAAGIDPAGGILLGAGQKPVMLAMRPGWIVAFVASANVPPAATGGGGGDTGPVVDELQGLREDLDEPLVVLPPTQRIFLNSSTASGTIIPIDAKPFEVTTGAPVTLEAADSDEVWAMFAAELSFTAACLLTFEGGAEDFVIRIPGAGIYSIVDRPLAYCQTAINGAMTITVSAGTCTGTGYFGKGMP